MNKKFSTLMAGLMLAYEQKVFYFDGRLDAGFCVLGECADCRYF